jgi:8-oxo-dGTP diphosphatase
MEAAGLSPRPQPPRCATADDGRRFPVAGLPGELAFDNEEILHYALQRLRNKVEYAHVAFQFLPPQFTMAQLRAVYEVILDRRIDPTNFRRRVEATGTIVPTGRFLSGGRHRPPAVYRCVGDPLGLAKTMRPRRPLRSIPNPLLSPTATS